MYQVMGIAEIWLGTRRKSAHANIAQLALSMCSSRYCSTFATLFFLYFWAIIVFWDSLTFSFYFFDIFSSLRSTRSNHRKYELKQVKDVACEISRRRARNRRRLCNHEKRILWPLFDQNKNFQPRQEGDGRIRNFFLIDFEIWNVKIRVRMRKLDQF